MSDGYGRTWVLFCVACEEYFDAVTDGHEPNGHQLCDLCEQRHKFTNEGHLVKLVFEVIKSKSYLDMAAKSRFDKERRLEQQEHKDYARPINKQ